MKTIVYFFALIGGVSLIALAATIVKEIIS